MKMNSTSVPKKKLQTRNFKLNKIKQFPLLNLYILVISFLEIIGEIVEFFPLQLLKPIPIILMIIYISSKNSQNDHLVPTLIRVGLIISLFGDVLLMINEMSAFMIGTVFFFISHIFYCVAYSIGTKVRQLISPKSVLRNIGYILYISMFIGNTYILWNKMPSRVLFVSYSLVLCIMNIFALKRYEITTPYSYGFIVAGSILFGLSDNLLGMLKFNGIKSSLGRGMIMLLYYAAQYLLMHGAMHHSNLQKQLTKFFKNSGPNTVPSLTVGKSKTNGQWNHEKDEKFKFFSNKNDQ